MRALDGSWSWLASWTWRQIDRMAFTPTGRLVNGLGQVAVLGLFVAAVGRRELRKSNIRTA